MSGIDDDPERSNDGKEWIDGYAAAMDMKASSGGGPAFPSAPYASQFGMTLRDYFAGQAIIALVNIAPDPDERTKQIGMAAWAYQIADSLLKAREAK